MPLLAGLLLALPIAGCGSDTSRPDSGAGGGQGEGGGTPSGSGTPAGGTGGSTLGESCVTNADCDGDQFCEVGGYACDDAQLWGAACALRPTECLEDGMGPVCGCDGALHASICEANAAGVHVAVDGTSACPAPAGEFRCGYEYCEVGAAYCERQLEMGYGCKPLPAQCAQSAEQTCDSCFGDDLPSSCDTCSDGIGIELTCANL